jgi:hypothetical protein
MKNFNIKLYITQNELSVIQNLDLLETADEA